MAFPHPRTTPDWSQAEIDLLLSDLARSGYEGMARRLGRTVVAIRIKLKRLGVGARTAQGYHSMAQIERILSLAGKTVSECWRPAGLATQRTAIRLGPRRDRMHLVNPADLRAFFIRRPEAFNWTFLAPRLRRQLGLRHMPARPASKIVACRKCGRENRVPLMAVGDQPDGTCRGCGAWLPKWAIRYSGERPEPALSDDPLGRLRAADYYDAEADKLRCLDCGRTFHHIAAHMADPKSSCPGHGTTAAYKRRHGLADDAPLKSLRALGRARHNRELRARRAKRLATKGHEPTRRETA